MLPPGFSLGASEAAVGARLERLERERFASRLWDRDPTLWGDDPAHRAVARNRLGWLEVAAAMRPHTAELEAFASGLRAEGFTHAVLLGMGGSSLAPEVLERTFGHASGLALTVLDSTSPGAVRAVTAAHDPRRTVFVVASKSGGTIEVVSFERHFWEWAHAALGDRAGRGFLAITDPGTVLERLAAERGYRRTFLNPADIGGRYSALSYFGLVPAALIGMDLGALLDAAIAEGERSRAVAASGGVPSGLVLGAAIGELALAGRDKLTLVLGDSIVALGGWVEQLVAESTGKNGRGIVPVVDEDLGPAEVYGTDRVFVAISVEALPATAERALGDLASAGHPVLRWRLPDLAAMGAEFLRWEIATATAAAVLEVDPFDEPNVTEAKQATQAVLEREASEGAPPPARGRVVVTVPKPVSETIERKANEEILDPVTAALRLLRPGDYFALLAYLPFDPGTHERLQRVRHAVRYAARVATTLGYGPRFLHSTGQLHKGGPATGFFLQLTLEEDDLPIPGARYGFRSLIRAQAAGDYEVLERRGARVVRVHLAADAPATLDALAGVIVPG